ncbi:MAG: FAD-binding protein [Raoultibacter sp.]
MVENGAVQTRRSFLKSAGVVLAGATALGVTGCAAQGAQDSQGTTKQKVSWDEEYDAIIVGAGAAGLATALTVATEGGETTALLLEKSSVESGGGNSQFSSGMCIFTEQLDNFYEYLKELRGEFTSTPDEVLKAFAVGLSENYTWLKDMGAKEEDLLYIENFEWKELPHSQTHKIVYFNPKNETGPKHLVFFLLDKIKEYPERIFEKTESQLVDLVQDPESKTILGVVYTQKGKTIYAKAKKGVVMTCGGFESDATMKQDYLSMPISHAAAGISNTGDGHRICSRIGADFWHMNSFAGPWTNGVALDGSKMLPYRGLRKAQGITVGINGRRFYMDWEGSTMFEADIKQGDDLSLRYGCRHGAQNFGGDYAHLPLPSTTWFVFDATGLANGAYLGSKTGSVTSQNSKNSNNAADPVADGFAYKADTIEELASQMGVPVGELAKTVVVWNESCANGEDEYFHRPGSVLQPIIQAPFYAVKCVPEVLNTDGGPRRGPAAEIIDTYGNPIPHLYSAGEFGSVWMNKYEGAGNIAECCAFGRIAARSVLENN